MGRAPHGIAQTRNHASSAMLGAIQSEIEAVITGRVELIGGRVAELSRFYSFVGAVMGNITRVSDILSMGYAGYQAITTERRIVTRVAAAHGYAQWMFQNRGLPSTVNPPNAFLVSQRQQDRSDARIGRVAGNESYSSDGGLSAADWNVAWRRGATGIRRQLESQVSESFRRGVLQRTLQEQLGPTAQVHRQSYQACASQYRTLFLEPRFCTPSIAAGSFLLGSMKGERRLEIEASLRVYQQYPYRPGSGR